jgi:Cysteine-rich CWC
MTIGETKTPCVPDVDAAHTEKTCGSCGATFACQASIGGCWCEDLKLQVETLAALQARYADCLCPQCLTAAKFAEKPENSASGVETPE